MEEEMRFINDVNERSKSHVVEINDSIPETKPLVSKKSAIYRRPNNAREEQDTFLFTPRIVYFGPYHHDKQTDKHKELAVRCLEKSGKTLRDYSEALSEVVRDLKDAYDELDSHWQQDDNAFLHLMIYDGCLFLEILSEAEGLDGTNPLGHLSREILAMYRISQKELKAYYTHDMLLLENQLPIQLLEKLVSVQKHLSIEAAQKELYERILRFVAPNIPEELLKQDRKHVYLHVLSLYLQSLLCEEHEGKTTPQTSEQVTLDSSSELDDEEPCWTIYYFIFIIFIPMVVIAIPIAFIIGLMLCPLLALRYVALRYVFKRKAPPDNCIIIPSATELDKIGIGFKLNKTKCLMKISFGGQILKLPKIYVDGAMQSRFFNIMAFEQLHEDAESKVTSYIYFMSRLLQVGGDVRLLQVLGILCTPLHNNQVVELFKSLTKDIVHDPNIFLVQNYHDVANKLTKSFYEKMNNPWQRELWQTYLKSPWAVISVIAACFLFTLTSVQTVYTVLSFYKSVEIPLTSS